MTPPGYQEMGNNNYNNNNNDAIRISSQLMIAAVIFLFMVVVFIFFLYLYAKHFMGSSRAFRRSRSRFIFVNEDQTNLPRRGLDIQILKSLPITVFRSSEFKEGLDCSVCLSEITDGEEARLLPKCNHGFHVECIDMWFNSHATCPLCRAPVEAELSEKTQDEPNSPVFPTNVLFWGTQEGTTSSSGSALRGSTSRKRFEGDGMLVIEIPRRAVEGFTPSPMSPLPTSRFAVGDMKSPREELKSPMSARLKSLQRLLSRGKRAIGASCSPRGGDIEEGRVSGVGEGSNLAPKTPTS